MAEHVCLLSTRYPGTKLDSVADGERMESSEHPIITDPHSNLVITIRIIYLIGNRVFDISIYLYILW